MNYCIQCGQQGELGSDLVLVTGHENGSQLPVQWIECADVNACIARINEKRWRYSPNRDKKEESNPGILTT